MSEEQYGKLVNMIGQMAEQITSNLTTKIETEIGSVRQEIREGLQQVNQRVDDLTSYTKQRIEIIERRLDNTNGLMYVVDNGGSHH